MNVVRVLLIVFLVISFALPVAAVSPVSTTDDANVLFIETPFSRHDIPVRVFGAEAKGTPVIMVHGLQSHSGWFVQSATVMAQAGVPVYLIDRYGSGLSTAPRGRARRFKQYIDEINVVAEYAMKTHGKTAVHMLGHCLGSVWATAYACEMPEHVKSLTITTPGIYTKTDVLLYEKFFVAYSKLRHARYKLKVPLKTSMFSEVPEYQAFIDNDELSLKKIEARFYYEVNRARSFIRRNSSQLTMPIFMSLARHDRISSNRENKQWFENKVPADVKKYKLYADAEHILEFSNQGEEFLEDLSQWIKKQEKT